MRDAARVVEDWPKLAETMQELGHHLMAFLEDDPSLRGLAECCGKHGRPPPSVEVLSALRARLEDSYNLKPGTFELHHPASPWRYGLLGLVVQRSGDPDSAMWCWLKEGAPMGLEEDIEHGGTFPVAVPHPSIGIDVLDKMPGWTRNHESFSDFCGSAEPPAWDLLREQVSKGFAFLFRDAGHAAEVLGAKVHPAPLGNVAKLKEDGTYKHRLIQYLRANLVRRAPTGKLQRLQNFLFRFWFLLYRS